LSCPRQDRRAVTAAPGLAPVLWP